MKRSTPMKRTPFKSRAAAMPQNPRLETKPPKPRTKACNTKKGGCGKQFETTKAFVCWCSPECGLAIAQGLKAKTDARKASQERRETREKLDKIKSPAELADEAQAAVNRWVRWRDHGKPCISCGTTKPGTIFQAGHYLSRGAHPELRFHPDNIHLQCVRCNMHKAGNATAYRIRLIKRIGLDRVEWLEGPHEPLRLRADDYRAIKKEFTAKANTLRKAVESAPAA